MTLPEDLRAWPAEWYELLQERIAIMNIEGGMPLFRAMREAIADIRKLAKNEGN